MEMYSHLGMRGGSSPNAQDNYILRGLFVPRVSPAGAQEIATAFDTSSPMSEPVAAPAPAPSFRVPPSADLSPSDRDEWQVGVGFQYVHFGAFTV